MALVKYKDIVRLDISWLKRFVIIEKRLGNTYNTPMFDFNGERIVIYDTKSIGIPLLETLQR